MLEKMHRSGIELLAIRPAQVQCTKVDEVNENGYFVTRKVVFDSSETFVTRFDRDQ